MGGECRITKILKILELKNLIWGLLKCFFLFKSQIVSHLLLLLVIYYLVLMVV